MTTANTLTLFTEEPLQPAQAIPAEELAYNAAFRLRLAEYQQQRKIAEIEPQRAEQGIPVRYQGVLVTQIGEAWKAVRVETVIWHRGQREAVAGRAA